MDVCMHVCMYVLRKLPSLCYVYTCVFYSGLVSDGCVYIIILAVLRVLLCIPKSYLKIACSSIQLLIYIQDI